ncbi:MAG: hypothetical protein HQ453_05835 [Actinobacteria bacterium]|nr:hypothetical protein [Actinomycetota bacterium]
MGASLNGRLRIRPGLTSLAPLSTHIAERALGIPFALLLNEVDAGHGSRGQKVAVTAFAATRVRSPHMVVTVDIRGAARFQLCHQSPH